MKKKSSTSDFQQIERYIALTQSDVDSMRHVYNADGVIYRGIPEDRAIFIEELFEKGVFDTLINAGLLTPSRLERRTFKGYSILIEQNELTPPILAKELPPSLRRDAGLVLLRIAELLDERELALYNFDLSDVVLSRTGRPVFHNLSTIVKKGSHKFPYAEFYANFLAPLRLVHEKPELADLVQRANRVSIDEDVSIRWPLFRKIVRRISCFGGVGGKVSDFYQRLTVSPFSALLNMGRYKTFIVAGLKEREVRKNSFDSIEPMDWNIIVIKDLYKHLGRFKFENISQKWTDYHAHLDLAHIVCADEDWEQYYSGPREQALLKVLDSVESGTVLDIGANNGYFSMLAAHKGFVTTAIDYDIGAIDRLYRFLASSNSTLTIRPLILDFVNLDLNSWKRFRSDVVFALGFIHHMRLVELLPWDIIAERLSGLTEKVLVTEFKNNTGASHAKSELTKSIENDYCMESLLNALGNCFKSVEVVGDYSVVGFSSVRTMIVCRH